MRFPASGKLAADSKTKPVLALRGEGLGAASSLTDTKTNNSCPSPVIAVYLLNSKPYGINR